mmetsp:Transcript_30897/g.44382  ORF Transcript_30897/g.44382 Transcript_30897/m.44382 type:complete len:348 (-) Transcript_30897:86-1129(-)
MFRKPSPTSFNNLIDRSKNSSKLLTRYGVKQTQSNDPIIFSSRYFNEMLHNKNDNIAANNTNSHPYNLKDPVIATVLTTRDFRYIQCFFYFLTTLEATGYSKEVILLIADGRGYVVSFLPINKRNNSQTSFLPFQYNGTLLVRQLIVPAMETSDHFNIQDRRYSKMISKLHIWALYEYRRIIYYDLDFIFLRNPLPAVAECDHLYQQPFSIEKTSNGNINNKKMPMLCVTEDKGMTKYFGKPAGSYFNCGFMIVQPNQQTYNWLMSRTHLAERKQFVEQDMLNELFANNWLSLPSDYNIMHVSTIVPVGHLSISMIKKSKMVAIHEKFWVLQQQFRDSSLIWNQQFV